MIARQQVNERFLFPKEPLLRLSSLWAPPRLRAPKLGGDWAVTWGCSARYALYRLLLDLPRTDRDEILVPAYACIALVEPILAAGYKVRFFDNPTLTDTDLSLVTSLATKRTRVLIVIHYFGYRHETSRLAALCRDEGILLLENFTHSLPVRDFVARADRPMHGDVALFSLKKMLPVPDGGFAIHRLSLRVAPAAPTPTPPPLMENMRELYRLVERSLTSRRWRPTNGTSAPPNPLLGPQSVAEAAEIAASMHGLDPNRIAWDVSGTSRRLWESSDLDAIASTRRRNAALIQEALRGLPGIELPFRDAPDDSCFWGVPFLAPGVTDLDYKLRSLGLPVFTFARALHPALGSEGFDVARSWAAQLKLLPVHQDLTPDDISHVRPAFEAALSRHAS